MNLLDLKLSYRTQHTQFITIDGNGVVLESDNILFNISSKKNISKIHPFFESTLEIISNSDNLEYSCVHIEIKETNLICDISIKKIESNLYLIIITDFSNHYNSFRSLVQSRNETTIKSEFLLLNNQLLKEKEVFKNKFIANFSHEVRNPITSIVSFINLLRDTKLNREQDDYLDIIRSSSLHLNSIINDILDISKIETGKLEIKSIPFNLEKLVEQIRTKYELRCSEKKLEFNVVVDGNVPTYIESDKTRIQQLIQNLLDNAIKFTQKGSVSLEIKNIYKRAKDLTLSIIVKDTGTGIAQKDHTAIFHRFYRLENASETEGIGLGLTIVKEIVELMDGDLHFESEPNKGTIFTINLKTKFSLIQKESNKKIKHKAVKKTFRNKPKKKHNILLVEDNTTHQLGVFKILARTKLFYLDIVNNGIDAIKSVNKTNYDVVLMDFKLPSLNGLEASKAIKNLSDKKKKKTPIILVTGSIIDNDLLKLKGIYFYDIIEKPFEEDMLINTIISALK